MNCETEIQIVGGKRFDVLVFLKYSQWALQDTEPCSIRMILHASVLNFHNFLSSRPLIKQTIFLKVFTHARHST